MQHSNMHKKAPLKCTEVLNISEDSPREANTAILPVGTSKLKRRVDTKIHCKPLQLALKQTTALRILAKLRHAKACKWVVLLILLWSDL